MGTETFKKRQKEASRRLKRQIKAARLKERREKTKNTDRPREQYEEVGGGEPGLSAGVPGKPVYFGAVDPRGSKKKSEITLHNAKRR